MTVLKTLVASVAMILAANTAVAGPKDYPLGQRSIFSDRAVEERIKPVGSVCVEGEDCASEKKMAAADSGGGSGARSGSDIYGQYCSTCHKTGASGAPITGKAADWEQRISKGMDTLVKHAWQGFNAMPPKGMCNDCSKEEIRATVEHMVEKSR